MSVTNVTRDAARRTLTITSAFDAPIDRVWLLWADPRRLERWWGPPGWPATVEAHELKPGGDVGYYMTGPGGEKARGWWRVRSVEAPRRLEFDDGFADDTGRPNPAMPVSIIRVALDERGPGRTEMTITTTFPSDEAMNQLLAMGMEEGMTLALGQADALVAA